MMKNAEHVLRGSISILVLIRRRRRRLGYCDLRYAPRHRLNQVAFFSVFNVHAFLRACRRKTSSYCAMLERPVFLASGVISSSSSPSSKSSASSSDSFSSSELRPSSSSLESSSLLFCGSTVRAYEDVPKRRMLLGDLVLRLRGLQLPYGTGHDVFSKSEN